MNVGTRAAIAYVAGRLIAQKNASAVYDFTAGGFRMFSGTVHTNSVSVFDFTDSCHVTGSGSGGRLSLYHFGESAHITLNIDGQRFTGYDFGSSSHFNGTVSGNSVTLYDFGESQFFHYTV